MRERGGGARGVAMGVREERRVGSYWWSYVRVGCRMRNKLEQSRAVYGDQAAMELFTSLTFFPSFSFPSFPSFSFFSFFAFFSFFPSPSPPSIVTSPTVVSATVTSPAEVDLDFFSFFSDLSDLSFLDFFLGGSSLALAIACDTRRGVGER